MYATNANSLGSSLFKHKSGLKYALFFDRMLDGISGLVFGHNFRDVTTHCTITARIILVTKPTQHLSRYKVKLPGSCMINEKLGITISC